MFDDALYDAMAAHASFGRHLVGAIDAGDALLHSDVDGLDTRRRTA